MQTAGWSKLRSLLAATGLVMSVGMLVAPTADADMTAGNYQLNIPDRYDFHTWAWAIASCGGGTPNCRYVYAIPMPVARAFEYTGEAHLVGGRYTLTVDVPDGLRCGNVYYGSTLATRDTYTWDAITLQGTLESSFDAGCDGAPGALTYPFRLARM
jgi:hypothetical protein